MSQKERREGRSATWWTCVDRRGLAERNDIAHRLHMIFGYGCVVDSGALYAHYHSKKHRRGSSEDVIARPNHTARLHLGDTIKGRGHQKWHCNAAAKANFQVYLACIFFIEPVFSRKWCGPSSSCEKLEHRSVYILKVRLTRKKAHSETIEHTARPERVHPVASCSIEEEYSIDFRGAGNEDGEHHWLPILVILIPCLWRCHDLRLSFHSVHAWSTACSRRRSRRMGHQVAPYRRKE